MFEAMVGSVTVTFMLVVRVLLIYVLFDVEFTL